VTETFDVAVIGAGAAGLMAAICAGRAARSEQSQHPNPRSFRVIALDGARTLGAKILVAGGGRCNVTHHAVDEHQYTGASRNAIKKILRRFDVAQTIEFFSALGVELKREETGKLFPTTDRARTVLDALLNAAHDAGVEIRNPWRVGTIREHEEGNARGFLIEHTPILEHTPPSLLARRVVLATGGKSLPKTGSDGEGYHLARALGHTITPRVFPALVPLTLPPDHFICTLSGFTLPATFEVRSGTGKRLVSFTNSTLCAHFGLSGPSVLDISRYYLDAQASDPGAVLVMNWLPDETLETVDNALRALERSTPARWLRDRFPERATEAFLKAAQVPGSITGDQLTREQRRRLATIVTETPLPITGSRGFTYAEVTAGGVPLSELRLETMESRACPGLHLCGEICDVDGRIGGFNFQWAWASGFVAGSAAGAAASTTNSACPISTSTKPGGMSL